MFVDLLLKQENLFKHIAMKKAEQYHNNNRGIKDCLPFAGSFLTFVNFENWNNFIGMEFRIWMDRIYCIDYNENSGPVGADRLEYPFLFSIKTFIIF